MLIIILLLAALIMLVIAALPGVQSRVNLVYLAGACLVATLIVPLVR